MQSSQLISLYDLLFEENNAATSKDNASSSADNAKKIGAVLKPIVSPILDDTTKIKATVATTNRNLNKLLGGQDGGSGNVKTTANTTPPNPGIPPTTLSTRGGEGGKPPKGADPATTQSATPASNKPASNNNGTVITTLSDLRRLLRK